MWYKLIFSFLILVKSISLTAQSANDFYRSSQNLMNKGDLNEALIFINKALVLDSAKSGYFLQKALVYYKMAKYDQAIRYCYSALKIEPENLNVFLLRGQICLVTESYGGSIFFFDKIIKQSTDTNLLYLSYLNRAKVYHALGKVKDENNDLRFLRKLTPDSIEVLYLLAQNYQTSRNMDSAYVAYNNILTSNPNNCEVYKKMAEVECARKNYTHAIEVLKTYQKLKEDDKNIYAFLSTIYIENQDFDNAVQAIRQAIVSAPQEPANYKILSSIYLKQERKEEGCNYLFKAFQLGYIEKYGYDMVDVYLANCEH